MPNFGTSYKLDDETRFWRYVRKTDSCWIWIGPVTNRGYGVLHVKPNKSILAHRYSYSLAKILISSSTLDHLCENKLCVNPLHLEEVTRGINTKRANKKRWHSNV